jgi:hypothetical protein
METGGSFKNVAPLETGSEIRNQEDLLLSGTWMTKWEERDAEKDLWRSRKDDYSRVQVNP